MKKYKIRFSKLKILLFTVISVILDENIICLSGLKSND